MQRSITTCVTLLRGYSFIFLMPKIILKNPATTFGGFITTIFINTPPIKFIIVYSILFSKIGDYFFERIISIFPFFTEISAFLSIISLQTPSGKVWVTIAFSNGYFTPFKFTPSQIWL